MGNMRGYRKISNGRQDCWSFCLRASSRLNFHVAELLHQSARCANGFALIHSLGRGVRFSSYSSTSSTEVGLEPKLETERPRIEDQATDRRSDLVLFLATVILKFELRIQKSLPLTSSFD